MSQEETFKQKQQRYAKAATELLKDASIAGMTLSVKPEDVSIVGSRVRLVAQVFGDATLTLEVGESALDDFIAILGYGG